MNLKRTIAASTIMILSLIWLNFMSHGENIKPNKSFATFPQKIGDWIGEEKHFNQKIYDKLGVDDSFLCNYNTYDGRQIELYIGFYQSQREGDLIHSPKNCLPGSGWNFVKEKKTSIYIETSLNSKITINNVLLQKGNEKQIMFYWFQGRGRYISSEYMQKIYLVLDSIFKRRTDETFIRLIAPVIDYNEETTLQYLTTFTKLLIPFLEEYLPS